MVHIPVLLKETLEGLKVQPGGRYVDGTVGGGGHAAAILEHSSPGGQLLGIDADPSAIAAARLRLKDFDGSVLLINDNFSNIESICTKYGFIPVHGILLDLGLSSLQLSSPDRGFSFQHDAPLDMRFGPNLEVTAEDIVNTFSEEELANLFRTYGEEPRARQIARAVARRRPFHSTLELARVVEEAVGGRHGKLHPATMTFQALRIAVNHELENLESALNQSLNLLGHEGRLVVISYHSLEDRIVKQFMQRESRDCICPPEVPVCNCKHKARLNIITRKVVTPTYEEVRANVRSRSAKLRVAERIINPEGNPEDTGRSDTNQGTNGRGWQRPALVEKLRKTFLAIQAG